MGTRHIENTTDSPMFVGGKMIPPGTGRDIDEALLPPEYRTDALPAAGDAPPSVFDLVLQLQQGSVKDIVAKLPELGQEALDLLAEAEKAAAKPRTSLLTAMDAERIRRANDKLQADADAAYALQLEGLTPEQLAAVGEQPVTPPVGA